MAHLRMSVEQSAGSLGLKWKDLVLQVGSRPLPACALHITMAPSLASRFPPRCIQGLL